MLYIRCHNKGSVIKEEGTQRKQQSVLSREEETEGLDGKVAFQAQGEALRQS